MVDVPKNSERGFSKDPVLVTPSYQPVQLEKRPPCQAGCANCGDIRSWIGAVAQRKKMGISRTDAFTRAWRTITEVNPFPSVLGRICPHPCESNCNRSDLDEPLAINALERFLGDWAIHNRLQLQRVQDDSAKDWIGVVGAGPSGLSFAYQMVRRGYRVTVYEAKALPGGMLRYGVPDYRLPPAILDAEITRILDLGVNLKLDTLIGRDISLDDLRERHATLYLGLGAQQGRNLNLEGEDGPSVWTGIDYLGRLNCGEKLELGSSVVVVGGGNTAVDAARSARRTGAMVTVLYRRSRNEMPAIQEEIDDMLDEGVELIQLAAPVRLERADDGTLVNLVAIRMALGEPGPGGRRRPEPKDESEFNIPMDSLIEAISQAPMLKGFETLDHEGGWLLTDSFGNVEKDILAGGDTISLGIAGNAIAQGRNAAEALHARLSGQPVIAVPSDTNSSINSKRVNLDRKPDKPAVHAPKLPGEERVVNAQAEVAGTITEEQFLTEVQRCFSCGSCMGCGQCSMFCTLGCYTRLEKVGPGMYFTLLRDACKECGKCIEVCPSGFIEAD